MSCKISYSEDAKDFIRKLDKSVQVPLLKRIEKLGQHPELGESLSNLLKNKKRVHVGKFRVIYSIVQNEVLIAKIGHRKDVYD
ncbi:MAG: type II toxin-antitoxin system RelE/ParE family toxin [Candidatus Micrarchaeota archaeon]|nr:type II toxin-antitoxin system RelE/ParE family toxin [Candidatus Micrarchaeota archaeon]